MTVIVAALETTSTALPHGMLEPALAASRWRCPDGGGVWQEGAVALGRAALITAEDESGPQTPLTLGPFCMVADARLDDRAALLSELVGRGAAVDRNSPDTLLLLNAWQLWGVQCLQRLIGDFAFILWDRREQKLIAARDHYGLVSLYYARSGTRILVSNSLNALIAIPGVDLSPNDETIADYLLFGSRQTGHNTFYRGISRLRPGHMVDLTFSPPFLSVKPYWRPEDEPPAVLQCRAGDVADAFRTLFDTVMRDKLRCDHIAAHLSGGMDSTSIAATLAHLLGSETSSRLRCYTTIFQNLIPELEEKLAREMAAFAGLPTQFIAVDDSLLHGPADSDPVPPEPFRLGASPAGLTVQAAATGHGRIVFTGFGGDPLLSPDWESWRGYGWIGESLRCARDSLMGPVPKHQTLQEIWRLLKQRRIPPSTLRDRSDYSPWLRPGFAQAVNVEERLLRFFENCCAPPRQGMAFLPLWETVFEQFSPDYTGLTLRAIHPFFDKRLTQFVASLPPLPWLRRKAVLRQAMRGRLPAAILRRPKQGLGGDPGEAFLRRHGPQRWMFDLLDNPLLDPWVDTQMARDILKEPGRWSPHNASRFQFVWSLSWWLLRRESLRTSAIPSANLGE